MVRKGFLSLSFGLTACASTSRRVRGSLGACNVDVPLPDERIDAGLRRGTFRSKTAPGDIGYTIWIPAALNGARIVPVCYLLHGYGGSADGLVVGLGTARVLAFLLTEQRVPPFALAACDGGRSFWHARRSGEDRMATFRREFVPLVKAALGPGRVTAEALFGNSMGGLGALLAARAEPSRYSGVALISPALWRSFEEVSNADAFDGARDFAAHDPIATAQDLQEQHLRIDCGLEDPFADGVRSLAARLPNAVVALRHGCHDEAFVHSSLYKQLAFIGEYFR